MLDLVNFGCYVSSRFEHFNCNAVGKSVKARMNCHKIKHTPSIKAHMNWRKIHRIQHTPVC